MAFLVALIGCSLLALAIDRHWRQWLDEPMLAPGARCVVGCLAVPCFATSLALHLEADPLGRAILAWGFEVMAAGVVVAGICGLRARAIARAERAAREATSGRTRTR